MQIFGTGIMKFIGKFLRYKVWEMINEYSLIEILTGDTYKRAVISIFDNQY